MLKINSGTTLDQCAEAIGRKTSSSAGNSNLKLATNWNVTSRPGSAALAAQLLVTWSRQYENPTLTTYVSGPDDHKGVSRLIGRLHGLIAVTMASQVFASDGRTDITQIVRDQVRDRLAAMNNLDLAKLVHGQAVDLVCVDHNPDSHLNAFYNNTQANSFRSLSEFDSVLAEILSAVSSRANTEAGPDVRNELAQILSELFTNTHLHAKRDESNNLYARSIRGVSVAQRNVPRTLLNSFGGATPPLAVYLEQIKRVDASNNLKFIELTILDSGPGFAARKTGSPISDDMTAAQEYDVVHNCFLANSSSTNDRRRGFGLPRVLRLLKTRGGSLMLRTGRLSLFRSFLPLASDRYEPLTDQEFGLHDAESESTIRQLRHRLSGTVVTVLIPIGLETP